MDAIVVDDDGSATEDEALSNGSEILVEDTDSEGIDDIGGHLEDTEPVKISLVLFNYLFIYLLITSLYRRKKVHVKW